LRVRDAGATMKGMKLVCAVCEREHYLDGLYRGPYTCRAGDCDGQLRFVPPTDPPRPRAVPDLPPPPPMAPPIVHGGPLKALDGGASNSGVSGNATVKMTGGSQAFWTGAPVGPHFGGGGPPSSA
jgi:hypothetical protein